MAKMTGRMQELFRKVRTVILARATGDGIPNAVPINAKKSLMLKQFLYLISTSIRLL